MGQLAYGYAVFDPGGRQAVKTTNSVKILMSEGMHDTAIVTLRGESMNVPELQPGTPVQIQYGWSALDLDWFYGYVDHIETQYQWAQPDPNHFNDVVCLGVSYALKDPYLGSWSNVAASSIVAQIAKQYFLSSVIEANDYLWPSLGATGCTIWQFLCQLADKVGYTLSCNQSLLRFVSSDTSTEQHWPSMPVFRTRNSAAGIVAQTISNFQALQGDAMPTQVKAIRQVNGLDLNTGQIIGAVNDGTDSEPLGSTTVYPLFYQQVSDTVVPSSGAALATLAGMSEANRWTYQATATLSGYTGVKQGMPIGIDGVDAANDGTWWVREVCHRIDSSNYAMDVLLGRDAIGSTGKQPIQGLMVAYSPQNPYSYTAANVPPTILVNNRWRAQNTFTAYVNSA